MSWDLVTARNICKYKATGRVWFHPICSLYAKLSLLVVAVSRHDGGVRTDLGAPEATVKLLVSVLMLSLRPLGSEASTSTEGLMSPSATRQQTWRPACCRHGVAVRSAITVFEPVMWGDQMGQTELSGR